MLLLDAYEQAVQDGTIVDDVSQREVICDFQRLSNELLFPKRTWWGAKKTIQGIYLFGTVGVGKTYLMDLFYEHVPEDSKARFHFHHFMQQIDAQLRELQGQCDPLTLIAKKLSSSVRLLCLDEFLVQDVAHAMMLAQLLSALFAQNMVLVATANTLPDDLYRNGPHRSRFLPAIELLKTHCRLVSLSKERDYRLGRVSAVKAYLFPLTASTGKQLDQQFKQLSENASEGQILTIQNRSVECVKCSEHAVWFTFDVLCNVPRCQLDYLEIADRFDTVFLSDIPILSADDTSRVVLFIHLIDVMYDRNVRLIASAAALPESLYVKGPLFTSFKRTISRLNEMQSEDYLKRHLYRKRQQGLFD